MTKNVSAVWAWVQAQARTWWLNAKRGSGSRCIARYHKDLLQHLDLAAVVSLVIRPAKTNFVQSHLFAKSFKNVFCYFSNFVFDKDLLKHVGMSSVVSLVIRPAKTNFAHSHPFAKSFKNVFCYFSNFFTIKIC
jgi:hypothetical protein